MNNRSRKLLSARNPLSARRNWPLTAAVLGTVLVVTGCGSGDAETASSASPSSSAASATPGVSPSTGASTDETGAASPGSSAPAATPTDSTGTGAASAPEACAAADLAGEVEENIGGGAAGSVYRTLVLTNVSSEPCTSAAGFPGVSYVDDTSNDQIGAAAVRSGEDAAAGGSFVLEPGQSVVAELKETRAENYGQECEPHQATKLLVYPPEDLQSLEIPHEILACENPNVELLSIGALQKR
ncbi:DUF4232 domain-containing protein [Arthrobacter gengyunqii]|uniref:DUF4232 domain-containing protein n=1 Tax=Arthrobacter gengyunqii TaxID=2886940 RepID=A0ABS8GMC0_9MICC|nr:DUF4232 domain-containing protein [Arthrobacter gengyunqii]MCC3267508.1 DUF4232 domain-containing protein [Arthrobacter gengyunqii]